MNERALSGVIMVGAAGLLAWAWLTGRLDDQIAQIVGRATGKAPAVRDAARATLEKIHGPGGARDPFGEDIR